MMAFILATDFDLIACMSKMSFFGKLYSCQWRFLEYVYLLTYVRRGSSAIYFDRVEITFILVISLAERLPNEGGEETGVPGENP